MRLIVHGEAQLSSASLVACLIVVFFSGRAMSAPLTTVPLVFNAPRQEIGLEVSIADGSVEYFVLDTGSGWPMLSQEVANRLKAENLAKDIVSGGSTENVSVDSPTFPQIACGDFVFPVVDSFLVVSGDLPGEAVNTKQLQALVARAAPPPASAGLRARIMVQHTGGLIGLPYFASEAVMLDLPHEQMTLWKNGHLTAADLADAGMAGAVSLPIKPLMAHNWTMGWTTAVDVSNGSKHRHLDMLVDTGTGQSVLDESTARDLGLTILGDTVVRTFRRDFICKASAASITLGDLHFENAPLFIGNSNGGRTALILGLSVFARYKTIFDFPARRMYVARSPTDLGAPPSAIAQTDLTVPDNGPAEIAVGFPDGSSHPMILSTSAMQSTLTPDAAAALLAAVSNGQAAFPAGQGLAIGGLQLPLASVSIKAAVDSDGNAVSGVYGVLGLDALSGYQVALDFQTGHASLYSPSNVLPLGNSPYGLFRPVTILCAPRAAGISTLVVPALATGAKASTPIPLQIDTAEPESSLASSSLDILGVEGTSTLPVEMAGVRLTWDTSWHHGTDPQPGVGRFGLDLLKPLVVLLDFPGNRMRIAGSDAADTAPSFGVSATPAP